ncbi:hypothetical protein [Agaribacter marinus]|uniref:Uncharacterized protein n=1 Tax=Agaribacter marinus TaxID=1431249 RepID=A0AA37T4S4_9ALTE|nr:hypothetical protein [Agaribacter marinus]GLR72098.1 hypothetical protein GCM10007852_30060 [Agaribacter marinus]
MNQLNTNEINEVYGGAAQAVIAVAVLGYLGGKIADSVISYAKNRERTTSSGGQMNGNRRLSQ